MKRSVEIVAVRTSQRNSVLLQLCDCFFFFVVVVVVVVVVWHVVFINTIATLDAAVRTDLSWMPIC